MCHKKYFILMLFVGLFGCKTQPTADNAGMSNSSSKSNSLRLSFLEPGAKAYQDLTTIDIVPVGTDESVPGALKAATKDPVIENLVQRDNANQVIEKCGGQKPIVEGLAFAPALAGWAVSELGSLVVKEADSVLSDEIKKYTVTYTANENEFDFYQIMSGNTTLDSKKSAMCFRFSQRSLSDRKDPKSATTLLLDFIGVVSFDPGSPDNLTFRPLRLFVQRVNTQTDDNKVVLNFKLSADAHWRDFTSVNEKINALSVSLLTETINKNDLANGPIYKVYSQDGKTKSVTALLPPWNYNPPTFVPTHGYLKARMTVTEVGNIPWLLKQSQVLLDKNKDAVTKDLVSEAQKEVGVSKAK